MSENLLVHPILLQKRWDPKRIKNNPLKSTKIRLETSIRIRQSSRAVIFTFYANSNFSLHLHQFFTPGEDFEKLHHPLTMASLHHIFM